MKRIIFTILLSCLVLFCTSCSRPVETTKTINDLKNEKPNGIDAFGVVKVKDIKSIFIDFPVIVEKVNICNGQKVKKGEVLLSLNLQDVTAQISSKKKQIEIEKYQLEKLINDLLGDQKEIKRLQQELKDKEEGFMKETDPDISKAKNDLTHAQDLYNNSRKELQSKDELYKAGTISQKDLDEFSKVVEEYRKNIIDASFALESLKKKKKDEIEQLKSRINGLLAQVDNATTGKETNLIKIQMEKIELLELELDSLNKKVNKSYINGSDVISDLENGIVDSIAVKPGDVIKQGQSLLNLMDLQSVFIQAEVAEQFIKDVKVGAEVNIIPLADKSRKYKGKVIKIYNKAFQKDGETNIPLDISFSNDDGFLMPDFNVDIEILN
ncbi:MAG: HlyD family secretion protein [Bacillota bacterium]